MKSSKKLPNLKPQICDIGNGRAESLRRWILSIPRKSMKTCQCENHLRVMWWAFLFIKCRQAEVPLKHLLLTRHTFLQYTTVLHHWKREEGGSSILKPSAVVIPWDIAQELQRCHYIEDIVLIVVHSAHSKVPSSISARGERADLVRKITKAAPRTAAPKAPRRAEGRWNLTLETGAIWRYNRDAASSFVSHAEVIV